MAKIRSPELAQLLMQAQFAPERQRVIQLDACENLMRLIQPGRDYPYEFVCFHLTGYRPRTLPHAVLIGYEDLAHDLAAYSEQLSKGLNIPALPSRLERAYTIEQLAKRFGVCVKTINRWRQRGLIGRYLVFKDGRKRLAFLGHAVELFEAIQGKSVEQGRAFSQLGPQERGQIERRLVRRRRFAGLPSGLAGRSRPCESCWRIMRSRPRQADFLSSDRRISARTSERKSHACSNRVHRSAS